MLSCPLDEVASLSRPPARHRKSQPRRTADQQAARARHRKPSPLTVAAQRGPALTIGALTSAALVAAVVGPAASGQPPLGSRSLGLDAAGASHPARISATAQPAGTSAQGGRVRRLPVPPQTVAHAGTYHGATPAPSAQRPKEYHGRHRAAAPAPTPPPPYLNPFRAVSGLLPERVDMGADFAGTGPVYALGNGVVIAATAGGSGWPGGGWISYRLTSGPAAGLIVYVAEDVTPTVVAGQAVSSSTVIGDMWAGSAGIETGWGQPTAFSTESQLSEAGGISGGGPFPTRIGVNFDQLLQALGVPAGSGAGYGGYGILPAGYSTDWAAALHG